MHPFSSNKYSLIFIINSSQPILPSNLIFHNFTDYLISSRPHFINQVKI